MCLARARRLSRFVPPLARLFVVRSFPDLRRRRGRPFLHAGNRLKRAQTRAHRGGRAAYMVSRQPPLSLYATVRYLREILKALWAGRAVYGFSRGGGARKITIIYTSYYYYYVLRYRSIQFYCSICFRRKMSTFAGQVDRHRGVVIKSTIAATEQEKSTEFGPKLASNFLHVFLVLFQGRRVVFEPLVPKRGRGPQRPSMSIRYSDCTSGSNRLAVRKLHQALRYRGYQRCC